MATTPLDKIRVSKICERCDVQRALFYYYFRDKYDLVAWIFVQDLRKSFAPQDGDTEMLASMATALGRMWDRRDFYRRAFEDRTQNSIEQYIQRFDVEFNTQMALEVMGVESLSPQQEFTIKSSSYGSIFCTVEWLRGDFEASPEQLAQWIYEGMPPFLQEVYRKAYSEVKIEYLR